MEDLHAGAQIQRSRRLPNLMEAKPTHRACEVESESQMNDARDELIRVEKDWARAIIQNDAEAIGRFMADDWSIIGSDGNVCDKATFLGLVRSGALTHDVMDSDDITVRVYGDAAVVIARGVSGGTYNGQTFREVERVSDVFIRQDGVWQCALTHLSRIASKTAE